MASSIANHSQRSHLQVFLAGGRTSVSAVRVEARIGQLIECGFGGVCVVTEPYGAWSPDIRLEAKSTVTPEACSFQALRAVSSARADRPSSVDRRLMASSIANHSQRSHLQVFLAGGRTSVSAVRVEARIGQLIECGFGGVCVVTEPYGAWSPDIRLEAKSTVTPEACSFQALRAVSSARADRPSSVDRRLMASSIANHSQRSHLQVFLAGGRTSVSAVRVEDWAAD
jgi:hypothetical protein